MKVYARLATAFLLLLALGWGGCDDCSGGGGEAGGGDDPTTVAVIPKGTTHEFWKSIHAGANKAGQELDVKVMWKGPVREDDRAEQVKVVEDFIARGVDGIVVAPLDDRALTPPLKEAEREGIPVVVIDSGIDWDGYVSFVATDNHRGGVLAAERMAELLGGEGRIVVMRYQEGSASTMKREAGFIETIDKEHPDIEIVSKNQYGGATTESSYATAEGLLVNYDDIDGIFTPNESTTFGMLRALQDGGRAGKVKLVGFDSSDKLIEGLREGQLHGLVLQDPFKMGELGVRTMVEHIRGEDVEGRIDTGVTMVTADNMDEPQVDELLEPDLSRWLK